MMSTESEIYQAARDVDGRQHCFIQSYTPSKQMTVVFPGALGKEHRAKFMFDYCQGYFTVLLTGNALQITLHLE